MRVLTLSHMYPTTYDPIYGSFVHDQAVAIKSQGVDLRVISPTPLCPPFLMLNPKWRKYRTVPKKTTIDRIAVGYPRYLSLPKNLFLAASGFSLYASLLRPRFRGILAEAEVIHAHTIFPDGLAAIMLKKKFPDKKILLTIHGADLQKKN